MGTSSSSPPPPLLVALLVVLQFASSWLCLFFFMDIVAVAAQVTDLAEAKALNVIFQGWGINSSSSDDPCSGAAHDGWITCKCSNSSTCHVTELKVSGQNVTGAIPQELQSLEHLESLDLSKNYLTGPVPAFFGAFSNLKNLSLRSNALSGAIPKELGNLTNLISLDVGVNNFTGTIPPELGGMISLENWYMDSSGLSGHLPSELSNLTNLMTIWASDNNFTGQLPSFFGSLKNLMYLRLQGNYFQGPIPTTFSNLTNMMDLRISDIMMGTGSSTLQFISDMKMIEILILRNCKISDALPLDFSGYDTLQKLDLSFNNISGSVPQSLFSLSPLEFLFLGNNSLSGSLPTQKNPSLTTVDLSYNQLGGSFPSWVTEPNLQLNLVANNFVIDDSNKGTLHEGLNCLQNNRPCHRDSPVYYSFAVNCGGSRTITASDKISYETDDTSLTSASYYVTDQQRWAISSVGTVVDAPHSVNYQLTGQWRFNKTLDTQLFQTSRLSPSSLRYYGLGLENGNYTVKLQFVETQFSDGPTWTSLGRRIFDIYIQGVLKEKDFDIRKEAGGNSFTVVEKDYTAPVTSNFLEIHFFWAGKGTCCVPYKGYYGPSISAISVFPKDFIPTVKNEPPDSSSTNYTSLAVGLAVGAAIVALAILCLILLWIRRKKDLREVHEQGNFKELLHGITGRPNIFSYAEMRLATNDFSSANLLGAGGYGPVFKGNLYNGRIVAVKKLSMTSHQGKDQFMTEIQTISAVEHINLVKLLGYCVEGDEHILVYEFVENKSLDQVLFGNSKLHLDWPKRFEICSGVASGLAYLHEESLLQIIHRDVKAGNVLLDADMKPKISDFGLAKLYDDKKTHLSTKIAGTIGYLAPEYAMRGHLTKKADVYAFGVLSLEILAGRPNADHSLERRKIYLLEWAWNLLENKRELELVDRSLSSFDKDEAGRVIGVALLCTQASPAQRPPMSRVVAMLAGDVEVPVVAIKPIYLDWQSYKDDNDSSAPDSIWTKNSSIAGTHATATSSSTLNSMLNSFIQGGR